MKLADLQFCGKQIMRLEGLSGFGSMTQTGLRERAAALLNAAGTEQLAEAAISALLADTARASNPDTNRLPSVGEIRLWVEAVQPERRYEESSTQTSTGGFCDLCRHGRPPGWITRTRVVKGNHYEFAGKCPRCNPGSYGGGAA